ncbi:hypothetical protein [Nocardia concava]|uniref:hypothetical protein n=1 Tax=Nocardia concava TaxID=257281 RepID=UPI0012FCAF98|nr:hypothetical protein [Nocardia concava]
MKPSSTTAALLALMTGVAMVVAVPPYLPRISVWAAFYGPPLIYLALAEYAAVAVGLVWWGLRHLHLTGNPSRRSPSGAAPALNSNPPGMRRSTGA